jgi:hypothetical protein
MSYDVNMWCDITIKWHNPVMTTASFHNLPSIEGEGGIICHCHTCNSWSGFDPSLLLAIITLRESNTSDAVIRSWGSKTNRRWISAIVPSDTLPSLWENKHDPLMIRSCEMWQCLARQVVTYGFAGSWRLHVVGEAFQDGNEPEPLTQWHSVIPMRF